VDFCRILQKCLRRGAGGCGVDLGQLAKNPQSWCLGGCRDIGRGGEAPAGWWATVLASFLPFSAGRAGCRLCRIVQRPGGLPRACRVAGALFCFTEFCESRGASSRVWVWGVNPRFSEGTRRLPGRGSSRAPGPVSAWCRLAVNDYSAQKGGA